MKCAKVIVFYFGKRRSASNNSQLIDLLPEIIQNETQIDVGYDTDTFFVINMMADQQQMEKFVLLKEIISDFHLVVT